MHEDVPVQRPEKFANLITECEFFDAHPELVAEQDLNNLRLRLPGNIMRKDNEEGFPILLDQRIESKYISEKLAQQTLREFYAMIDTEIERSGSTDLLALYHALRARGYSHYDLIR